MKKYIILLSIFILVISTLIAFIIFNKKSTKTPVTKQVETPTEDSQNNYETPIAEDSQDTYDYVASLTNAQIEANFEDVYKKLQHALITTHDAPVLENPDTWIKAKDVIITDCTMGIEMIPIMPEDYPKDKIIQAITTWCSDYLNMDVESADVELADVTYDNGRTEMSATITGKPAKITFHNITPELSLSVSFPEEDYKNEDTKRFEQKYLSNLK